MAIDLTVQYPGKIGPASGSYPYGEPRNVTTPGDGTGTPWEQAIVKETEGLKQALLIAAGITPNGTPDAVGAAQYLQAIVEQIAGRAQTYVATGTGDAIVLTKSANQESIQSYYPGLIIEFIATAANTTNVTVNVSGLGVVALNNNQDGVLLAGQIIVGERYKIRYNGTNFIMDELKLYMLDNIEQLLSAGGAATVATAVDSTTLNNVKAKMAVLNCQLIANMGTGSTGYNSVNMNVGKDSSITVSATNRLLLARVDSPVAVLSPGASSPASTQFTVELDSNHDFWYIQSVDDQAGGAGTETRGFNLVGYWA